MGFNFKSKVYEAQGSRAKQVATIFVLLCLSVGGGLFLFLNAQSKSRAIAPKTKAGGYKKLDINGGNGPRPTTSSFEEYSERIIECAVDEEGDDDSDVDIVYMANDGTVYRKCKYGLLDDDEIELEYDDETYSYR